MVTATDQIQVVISAQDVTVDSGPMSEFVGIAALADEEIPAIRIRGPYHLVIETLDRMRQAAERAFEAQSTNS